MDELEEAERGAAPGAGAGRRLGKGHSRLRTKTQLLEALKAALREPLQRLRDAAESVVPHAGSKVPVMNFPPGRKGRVRSEPAADGAAPSSAAAGSGAGPSARTRVAAGTVRRAQRRELCRPSGPLASEWPDPRRCPRRRRRAPPGGAPRARPRGATVRPPRTEPDRARAAVSRSSTSGRGPGRGGLFEAPTTRGGRGARRGSGAVRARSFASPRGWAPTPVLLVRDPTTLFVFWDFRRELERGAALGLRERGCFCASTAVRTWTGPRASARQPEHLRHRPHLGPGYTAEALLLGRDGWTRPVGSRSAVRRLPPGGFGRLRGVRAAAALVRAALGSSAPSAASAPRDEPLDSPRRVPLPTSPGAHGPGDRSGQPGGRRSGRN